MKVGDTVQLISAPYSNNIMRACGLHVGYIGCILMFYPEDGPNNAVLVRHSKGTTHLLYNGTNPGWWMYKRHLKVISRQLEFDFMVD